MHWIRRKLRGNVVYVKADSSGKPQADGKGLVEVVYKLAPGAKVYRASTRNLEPTGDPADDQPRKSDVEVGQSGAAPAGRRARPGAQPKSAPIPDDAVIVYTDGACTGNPGPAGIGAVIIDGDQRHELSEYLGRGTNNIAELTAIERALEEITDRSRTVVIHSDSSYSLGLLTKNWKAKANAELVSRLRALTREFADLRFVKVKGHAGIPENERADELARLAIENGR